MDDEHATMLAFTRYMKNEIVYEPCYARARGNTAAPVSRNQTAETCELQWVDKSGNPTPTTTLRLLGCGVALTSG
jgi:hypothetical protein